MPKISVILPCYNVEQYLARCLDSLMGQTLRDIEIICVNDGSTDGTLAALQKFAEADPRIIVISQENQGVAAARNAGLICATGEYVGFVDPDDYVDTDYFERLYTAAVGADADIAKASVVMVNPDGTQEIQKTDSGISADKFKFYMGFWSAIYRNKLLQSNNINFPTGVPIGEDIVFLSMAIFYTNKVAMDTKTNYYYVHHEQSAMASKKMMRSDAVQSCITAYQNLLELCASGKTSAQGCAYICAQAFRLTLWLLARPLTVSDKQRVYNAMIWVYQMAPDKSLVEKMLHRDAVVALIKGDAQRLDTLLGVNRTRVSLFGVVPVLKIENLRGTDIRIRLFEVIPVARMRRTLGRTHVYLCGIKILKLKY